MFFYYKGAKNWVKNCYVKVHKCSLRNSSYLRGRLFGKRAVILIHFPFVGSFCKTCCFLNDNNPSLEPTLEIRQKTCLLSGKHLSIEAFTVYKKFPLKCLFHF